jgi:hypothetical protein
VGVAAELMDSRLEGVSCSSRFLEKKHKKRQSPQYVVLGNSQHAVLLQTIGNADELVDFFYRPVLGSQ